MEPHRKTWNITPSNNSLKIMVEKVIVSRNLLPSSDLSIPQEKQLILSIYIITMPFTRPYSPIHCFNKNEINFEERRVHKRENLLQAETFKGHGYEKFQESGQISISTL